MNSCLRIAICNINNSYIYKRELWREWESARSQLWVRRKINFDMQEHLADFKGAFPLNNAQRNFSPFSKKIDNS